MDDTVAALRMEQVSKRYPGTLAVDGVDFEARFGEVHALMGENGSGKSTLMNVLAGYFDDYTGRILLNGKEIHLHSPSDAKRHGIQMIHQELSLASPLSIAENLMAGRLPTRHGLLDRRTLRSESLALLERVRLGHLDPDMPVSDLDQHEAQRVEIAKALGNQPSILIMDEPTSSLGRDEVTRLFEIIRDLRQQNLAIVYISHHLSEIMQVADRITVLRDGRKIATRPAAGATHEELVELMVGRAAGSELYARKAVGTAGQPVLEARSLSRLGFFHEVSFAVRSGEILGIGGLSGSGRTELARALVAIDRPDLGELLMDGKPIRPRRYEDAIRMGLAYVPEDRKRLGLAIRETTRENIVAAILPRLTRCGLFFPGMGDGTVNDMLGRLQVNPPDPGFRVGALSGGNQQKVLLAKWLAAEPRVLILDEPTRGVDIGAKVVIHRTIEEVAGRGAAVILISSDLPELVSLSDRIMIMRHGRMIGEMSGGALTEESVLLAANGGAIP